MFPPAPSQPWLALVKQTVWTLAGAGSGCQCWPPSVVLSSTPPTIGGKPIVRALPPATATPSVGLKKCTARIGTHGSGSACQCAPPSVVASTVVSPTTQPWLASVKSRLASPAAGLVTNCVTQCRPPSEVCRIRFEPTTQPSEADTNCTAFSVGCAVPGGFPVGALGVPLAVWQDGLAEALTDGLADALGEPLDWVPGDFDD